MNVHLTLTVPCSQEEISASGVSNEITHSALVKVPWPTRAHWFCSLPSHFSVLPSHTPGNTAQQGVEGGTREDGAPVGELEEVSPTATGSFPHHPQTEQHPRSFSLIAKVMVRVYPTYVGCYVGQDQDRRRQARGGPAQPADFGHARADEHLLPLMTMTMMMRIIRLARPASSGLVWRTETILCTDETNNNNNAG